jgi:hypothetical protein
MNLRSKPSLIACVGAGVVALGVAGPAAADIFTLTLKAPATTVAGQPVGIQASGIDPTDQSALYLELDAVPTSVATACPSGYLDGGQLASGSGGDLIAFDQREDFDTAGNFANAEAFTPTSPGQLLLCAYTDDGAGDTLATASAILNVQAAGGGGGKAAKPANRVRPRVTRSGGKLSCSRGVWSGSPRSWSYAWLISGQHKTVGAGPKLTVFRKLEGHNVQCRVTARNSAGAGTALSRTFAVH